MNDFPKSKPGWFQRRSPFLFWVTGWSGIRVQASLVSLALLLSTVVLYCGDADKARLGYASEHEEIEADGDYSRTPSKVQSVSVTIFRLHCPSHTPSAARLATATGATRPAT
jgi:hypothetical protein